METATLRAALSELKPLADSADNNHIADVVGQKADAAVTTVGTVASIVGYLKGILGGSNKIDGATTLGLAGTSNSLAYRVHEIEKHFHNTARWFGISASQAGTDWSLSVSAAGMPTSFVAISGTNDYGADANDEALIWGTGDTMGTDTKLDMHQIFITNSNSTTLWILRIAYGSGTLAAAVAAGTYSEIPVIADAAQGGSIDVILPILMPRITIGTDKIWIQAKNATNNATISFLVGGHSYVA
jgi:hypothetical protein